MADRLRDNHVSGVTYEMLSGPALKEVAEIWDGVPFNPLLSVAWVARDDSGKIFDMVVVHSVPIVEGLHMVNPKVGLTLINMAQHWLVSSGAKRVFMHSANPAVQGKIEKMGAEKCSEPMFEWTRG